MSKQIFLNLFEFIKKTMNNLCIIVTFTITFASSYQAKNNIFILIAIKDSYG